MPIKDLNQEQLAAVTHGDGPLLIVAGAGTGKTKVITERIAWLIEEKMAAPDEILALTFTDKAAGEMEERVDRLLPYGYVDLWVMTFHSFCERILKQYALDIGIANDFKLLNETEQWMLVKENLEKFKLDYYRPLGNPVKFIHALIKHFQRCKDEIITPDDYLNYAEGLKINLDGMEGTQGKSKILNPKSKTNSKFKIKNSKKDFGRIIGAPLSAAAFAAADTSPQRGEEDIDTAEIKRLEEVARAYHIYQQLLLDNEALDFGDLINYTLKLFRERSNILALLRNKFKYILVDEFQDTNQAQYELIKILAAPKNNLTTVLDDDQCIYAWRGAAYNNAIQFKKDYSEAREVSLVENYRSTQNILDLAYNFIQLNNPERLEAQFGSKALTKKLHANTEAKGIIEHIKTSDELKEVEAVANKIIELKNSDESASWNDFAILVRANSSAEPFVNGLNFAEIPNNFLAARGLYGKKAVRDVIAYLKLLDNYHESMAMWRILNLEVVDIDLNDLMELNRFAARRTLSLFEAMERLAELKIISDGGRKKMNYILKKIKEHTALARKKNTKEVILKFLEDFKYSEYLIKTYDERSFVYLQALLKKVAEFEKASEEKNCAKFLALVEMEKESGATGELPREAEEGPESVKVMTVHAAKGLEFKYVFIVNLVDKRFPSLERGEPIELPSALIKEIIPGGDVHLQEERRLFYVAVTRAKRGVWFSSAENYGGKTKKKLSRFLYEVGLEKEIAADNQSEKMSNSKFQIPNQIQNSKAQIKKEDEAIGKVKFELPKAFSYSQLKAFETCPYQYYLSYILKVPVSGKAVFSYGKTMHITLQRFMNLIKEGSETKQGGLFEQETKKDRNKEIKDKKIPVLDELIKIYKEVWIDEWYSDKKQKEEYRATGEKSLRDFYAKLKDKVPEVITLEQGFNFKLDRYTIRGVIDRVDRAGEDKVILIDYKTGAPKNEKVVDKDQLLIYQLAADEALGYKTDKLKYYYLDNNSELEFIGSAKELEKLREKIIKLIERIMATDWQALPSEHNCKYCDFQEICEHRK